MEEEYQDIIFKNNKDYLIKIYFLNDIEICRSHFLKRGMRDA